MSNRSEKVKAGIFVVITVSLLVTLLILVAGLRLLKTTRTFHVRFSESITGLEASSIVRYIGVPVGRVADIGFIQGENTLIDVTIEVNPDVPIRLRTRAQLKPQGITGITYIDLYDRECETDDLIPRNYDAFLDEGLVIPTEQSITKDLLDTLGELKKLLANMNGLIEDNSESIALAVTSIQEAAASAGQSLEQVPVALAQITELTAEVREKLSRSLESAGTALGAIEDFATDPEFLAIPTKVGGVLDRADAVLVSAEQAMSGVDLNAVMESLTRALDQLDKTAEEITAAVMDVRGGVNRNTGSLGRIMSDLRVFSTTMRQLSQDIREQPSRLIFPRKRAEREEEE